MGTPRSQNGYTANDRTRVKSRNVAGTNVNLTVRIGPAGDILLAFAADFHKYVENINNARGHLNDWGYAERTIRGSSTTLSNHASGTAIDLNADHHGLGQTGTYTPAQVRAIHKLLAKYGYCIRAGLDYKGRKDPMHFEIVTTEALCLQTLNHIKGLEDHMASSEYKALVAENKRLNDQIIAIQKQLGSSIGIIKGADKDRNVISAVQNNQTRLDILAPPKKATSKK